MKTYKDYAQLADKLPYKFTCFTLGNQELEITCWMHPPPTWSEAEAALIECAILRGIHPEEVDLGTVRMERLDAAEELNRIVNGDSRV